MIFKDKMVAVTGGAQGIGKCCAECFAREGATVHVIDIKDGPWFVGDLSDKVTLERFATDLIAKSGHVDVLVNNAMPLFKGIDECTYEEFAYAQAVPFDPVCRVSYYLYRKERTTHATVPAAENRRAHNERGNFQALVMFRNSGRFVAISQGRRAGSQHHRPGCQDRRGSEERSCSCQDHEHNSRPEGHATIQPLVPSGPSPSPLAQIPI